ncbi:MAG: manganese efflux pump [Clostridia bacterium]|nr:manganese efflux pump [Clostridia bacterium]
MHIWELFLIAAGLSADAFAISLIKGLSMARPSFKRGAVIALFFGGSQAVMPIIGHQLGRLFSRYIISFEHLAAFTLLLFIGAKMIYEAVKGEPAPEGGGFDIKELFLLSIATSIDALTVGIGFAFLKTSVICAAAVIGGFTFAVSFAGVMLGSRFGTAFGRPSAVIGGAVIIFIAVKMLFEHMGILIL